MKDVSKLTVSDLQKHRVWRFVDDDERGETMVAPVKKIPVRSLSSSLVGAELWLASGRKVTAFLGNIDVEDSFKTLHFLTLSVFRDDGALFHLARYHDVDVKRNGPDALAAFLKMRKEEVFPITWDVRSVVSGQSAALHGKIEAVPKRRLTETQITALALS